MTDRPVTGPGVEPRWTSSAKSGVGTAFDERCHVWFTVSHGIIDEVYYPRVDQANTRDFGLLVSGPDGFFSEEKRNSASVVHLIGPGVPGYKLVNTCRQQRFEIEKTVITDPERDVLLQRVRFRALKGKVSDYRIFALLAPHICNQGYGNDGWAEMYKGVSMLFAKRNAVALAMACDTGWSAMSTGYVGVNDGWRQVKEHGYLAEPCSRTQNGNIALCGEVDLAQARFSTDGEVAEFVLILSFGQGEAEAAQRARMSLASSFDLVEGSFIRGWTRFHERTIGPRASHAMAKTPEVARQNAKRDLAMHADSSMKARRNTSEWPKVELRDVPEIELPESVLDLYRTSAAVLAIHEDKRAPGAIIASLSIPWGNAKGDHEMGGYHLVWPRDLVNSAGALLALGHTVLARRTLRYLMSTQEADGRWAQNLWLDGTPYWNGLQMDEVAFPILFAELLRREEHLVDLDPYPMIRKAAGFLMRHGPVTGQDRWEENGGYSVFTLAVEIAALLVAADFAERNDEADLAELMRETADAWNARVEEWTYVRDTPLAREVGVDGYYVRISPPDVSHAVRESNGYVPIKNRPWETSSIPYGDIISPDALGLVRFGLRSPDDPRMLNTIQVIDAKLKATTSTGPAWYRYNHDGYGEMADGSAFDGIGIGRPWPLLAGERAHYELAAGHPEVAVQLLGVMRAQASDGGMLPEQVWDGPDIPELELTNGRPTGGAMPLVWAHAEYAKLIRSLHDGRVFDMPQQPYDRYVRNGHSTDMMLWAPHNRGKSMRAGSRLRIQVPIDASVRWSVNNEEPVTVRCRQTAFDMALADIDTAHLAPGAKIQFVYFGNETSMVSETFEIEVVADWNDSASAALR